MGKLVSIDLDPALVADYERAAGEHGRSLEVELAEALATVRPKPRLSRDELVALVHENWARTPAAAAAIDSIALIREDRDRR